MQRHGDANGFAVVSTSMQNCDGSSGATTIKPKKMRTMCDEFDHDAAVASLSPMAGQRERVLPYTWHGDMYTRTRYSEPDIQQLENHAEVLLRMMQEVPSGFPRHIPFTQLLKVLHGKFDIMETSDEKIKKLSIDERCIRASGKWRTMLKHCADLRDTEQTVQHFPGLASVLRVMGPRTRRVNPVDGAIVAMTTCVPDGGDQAEFIGMRCNCSVCRQVVTLSDDDGYDDEPLHDRKQHQEQSHQDEDPEMSDEGKEITAVKFPSVDPKKGKGVGQAAVVRARLLKQKPAAAAPAAAAAAASAAAAAAPAAPAAHKKKKNAHPRKEKKHQPTTQLCSRCGWCSGTTRLQRLCILNTLWMRMNSTSPVAAR